MGVAIHWRPFGDTGKRFKRGTSSDLEALKNAFHGSVGPADVVALRAMAHAAPGSGEFYNEVADLVERVGSITFWGEY